MPAPTLGVIAPLFVATDVPATLAFYRDKLGFEITFQGPEPDDIFFGIVERGGAMIMFKDIGVAPVPNCTKAIKRGHAPWDAYVHTPDPDALAAEFTARGVEFWTPIGDNSDDLRGFEIQDWNSWHRTQDSHIHTSRLFFFFEKRNTGGKDDYPASTDSDQGHNSPKTVKLSTRRYKRDLDTGRAANIAL